MESKNLSSDRRSARSLSTSHKLLQMAAVRKTGHWGVFVCVSLCVCVSLLRFWFYKAPSPMTEQIVPRQDAEPNAFVPCLRQQDADNNARRKSYCLSRVEYHQVQTPMAVTIRPLVSCVISQNAEPNARKVRVVCRVQSKLRGGVDNSCCGRVEGLEWTGARVGS